MRALNAAFVLAAALALLSCGGETAGVGSGGTGGGPTSSITGAVTGFGSVVVDGQSWDDRTAIIETEIDPRLPAVTTEASLGERVEVESSVSGVADRVRIEAAVVGPVSEVSASASPPQFKVAGQTVRLNANANSGPVTVLEGYTSLAQMAVSDLVEVHGTPLYDAALSRYVIQASRVEKLAALPNSLVRVAGVVEGYQASAMPPTFRIGELTVSVESQTVVVPANRAIANGQTVIVFSSQPIAAGPRLAADAIRIRDRLPSTGNARTQLSGPVSRYDAANASFEIAGVRVDARAARITPAGQALAGGLYVVVSGSYNGSGILVAESVHIRSRSNNDVELEIRGTITDYVSIASFKVRDTLVDATGAELENCPNGLANGQYVELEGRIDPATGRARAEEIECKNAPPTATITVTGVASAVNGTARTFTVTPSQGTVHSVQWTNHTVFSGGLNPANLDGVNVEVEGFVSGPALIAQSVKRKT